MTQLKVAIYLNEPIKIGHLFEWAIWNWPSIWMSQLKLAIYLNEPIKTGHEPIRSLFEMY